MFHVRRRPADSQPRRRKKKPLGVSNGSNHVATDREGPILVEITHSGEGARSVKLTAEPIEVSNLTYYQNRLINICSRLLISIMTYIHIDVPYQRNNNDALLFFHSYLIAITCSYAHANAPAIIHPCRLAQQIQINCNCLDHRFNRDIA